MSLHSPLHLLRSAAAVDLLYAHVDVVDRIDNAVEAVLELVGMACKDATVIAQVLNLRSRSVRGKVARKLKGYLLDLSFREILIAQ